MPGFLEYFVAFPTVIFTVLLGISILYWLLVIVGAIGMPSVDLDVGLDGGLEGGFEGVGEGLGGGAEGLEGVGEGVEAGAAGEGSGGILSGLLNATRLGAVPTTVALSMLVFWMWLASMVGNMLLRPLLGNWGAATVSFVVVLPVAFISGVILASLAVRPLAPLFIVHSAPSRRNLAGRILKVRSGRVTADLGQAELADGGAGLVLSVRCEKENSLKRGDMVVVVSYDEKTDTYDVEPADWLEPGDTIGHQKIE